jgi:predicted permease
VKVLERWLHRWRHIWSRRIAERELEDEMRFHLEMEARDRLSAGLNASEARRLARVDFGGVDRYSEQVRDARGLRWLTDMRSDVRIALRALRRHPGFAAIVVAILAVAIGANTAVFGIVDRVLLRSLPYPDDVSLTMLWQGTRGGQQWVSAPDARDWSERLRTFEGVAAFTPERLNIAGRLGAETVTSAAVDGAFFDVLGVPPARGRVIGEVEAQPGSAPLLVLSDALWRRRFSADPDIVGNTVSLEGSPATVIGIMPPDFAFPAGAEIWTPLRAFSQDWHARRGIDWLQVIGRVRPGVGEAAVASDLETVSSQLADAYAETNGEDRIEAVPLREQLYGDLRLPALVLMASVGFILLMSCAAVAGLLLARATTRGPETALRLALGSGRNRITRALLTESAVIAAAGGILGVPVANIIGRLLLELAPIPETITPGPVLDPRILAFAVAITLTTTILFGLAPAFLGSRSSLQKTLRSSSGANGASSLLLRRGLVIGQIAIAVILVTGGLLFGRSLNRLLTQETGFNVDGITTARIALTEANYPDDADRTAFFDALLALVSAHPGVDAAAVANSLPLAGSGITFSFEVENSPPVSEQDAPLAGLRVVSSSYFRAMGIPVLAGRDFDSRETQNSNLSVIVDSTLAQHYIADRNPLGTQIRIAGAWRTIVGTVGAVRHSSLDAASVPTVYLPVTQRTAGSAFVVVRGSRTTLDPSLIADAVRTLDPEQPVFALRPMRDYVKTAAAEPRFLAFIIGAFALAALIIAALGVYGIVAFNVTRRSREFGIRLAVGARPGAILREALNDGIVLLVIGLPIGAIGAFALARFLEGVLFGVRSDDPATFVAVVLLLAIVILAASWLPSRRAAHLDPIRVLRSE